MRLTASVRRDRRRPDVRQRTLRAIGSLVLVATLATATACAADDAPLDARITSLTDAFSVAEGADGQQISGHGIAIVVPSDWVSSGSEHPDVQGRTYEWGMQAPAGGAAAFPPYISMSMGIPGTTSTGFEAAPDALKTLGSTDPGFTVLDEGRLDLPGAQRSYRIRFERPDTYRGRPVRVEVEQIFLAMPDGVLSTVRLQAPAGGYDDAGLEDVAASLVVTAR